MLQTVDNFIRASKLKNIVTFLAKNSVKCEYRSLDMPKRAADQPGTSTSRNNQQTYDQLPLGGFSATSGQPAPKRKDVDIKQVLIVRIGVEITDPVLVVGVLSVSLGNGCFVGRAGCGGIGAAYAVYLGGGGIPFGLIGVGTIYWTL
ncbi:hypothetical protein GCK72_001007 [Caenorhabditis remanei]|uniref:Uncharacterized protein n=1 Tax=Caenorhabditis remanei TaxID=31234 RepID=A0A6A5HSL0_CAERE|nr:hypothetical protein GCK72_001007 [Caenorhabditis remanei]KAF1769193.1 hypothetical protein GCK72_001007 [Caenorhabditis remanei]